MSVDSAQSGKMQRVDALRIVEFRMGLTPNVNIINYLGAYSSGGKGVHCMLGARACVALLSPKRARQ